MKPCFVFIPQHCQLSTVIYVHSSEHFAWATSRKVKLVIGNIRITINRMGWDDGYDYIYNEEALREVDEKMVEEFVRLQVELLGGDRSLYERVNASLKEIKVIKDIEEHQKRLFQWREDFFMKHFKFAADKECKWYSTGGDDHHGFDFWPFEITCNFDNVMRLAASKKFNTMDPRDRYDRFFFEAGDEEFCYKAQKRFGTLGQFLRDEGEWESSDEEKSGPY